MRNIRVKLIQNNASWVTLGDKANAIEDFFNKNPYINMSVDLGYSKFQDIPFENIQATTGINDSLATTPTIERSWFNTNILPLCKGYDIVIFHISEADKKGRPTSTAITGDMDEGTFEITYFGGNETDHSYINLENGEMRDMGNSFVFFCWHEISHGVYRICDLPDKTHRYFYAGEPEKVLADFTQQALMLSIPKMLIFALKKLLGIYQKHPEYIVENHEIASPEPQNAPSYDWSTRDKARYSCRVIMDTYGLRWIEKDLLCAVIEAESGFKINAKNENKKGGKVLSTDWGICQINDFYHIGKGKYFASVEEVLMKPEKSVQFMIEQYNAGHLDWWIAYKSGAFRKFLPK